MHSSTILQLVQNMAAWLDTGAHSRDHITPVLRLLHWLPVTQQIHVKLATLVYMSICPPRCYASSSQNWDVSAFSQRVPTPHTQTDTVTLTSEQSSSGTSPVEHKPWTV